jgi:hypothetical protein
VIHRIQYLFGRTLKDVEAWNIERHETLKHISRACFGPVCPHSKEEFAKHKSSYILELNTELKYLRRREAARRDASLTDGLTIEKKLGSILDLLRWKVRDRNVFHGVATSIDHCFDEEQRRMLFVLLDDIEDQVYRPINRARVRVWLPSSVHVE